MRQTGTILLFLLLPLFSQAQRERHMYEPRLFQTSLRVGFLNASINAEYRLAPRLMVSIDGGVGVVYIVSHYYNRFNRDYEEYDKYYDDFLNLGWAWWSAYTSLQLKGIIPTPSHISYHSAPYSNTFLYYGLQVKYNAPQFGNNPDRTSMAPFRETYQFAAIFGRQIESQGKAAVVGDLYIGAGYIGNYRLSYFQPRVIIGLRAGLNLWRKNH